jgi:hypothetical protein
MTLACQDDSETRGIRAAEDDFEIKGQPATAGETCETRDVAQCLAARQEAPVRVDIERADGQAELAGAVRRAFAGDRVFAEPARMTRQPASAMLREIDPAMTALNDPHGQPAEVGADDRGDGGRRSGMVTPESGEPEEPCAVDTNSVGQFVGPETGYRK